MMTDAEWKPMADWSDLPDVYVTKAECQQGMFWRIEACSVPMVIGPEVRLVHAHKLTDALARAEKAEQERDALADRHAALLAGAEVRADRAEEMLTKEPQQTWRFDRYVNGVLMAEGVEVTRAATFEEATAIAARLAARGRNGETPVLVLCAALDALARVATLEKVGRIREAEWATFRDALISNRDRLAAQLAEAQARWMNDNLKAALDRLVAVLDRNETKGPIPDVEMMFCWMAAQDVRAALRAHEGEKGDGA